MIRLDSVEGNEEAKLAIALLAVDPTIGGVLFVGPPGVAKSTLARSLADLGEDAPFVEVPLGATEDRVKGSIDVASALRDGEVVLRRGLLGAANGGVLYLDEVNLQPDHIVDLLLDAAATGVNRVERDGLSATEPARFALVATMNPEEGALRPQLRDRFAMLVEVGPPRTREARLRALRRALRGENPSVEADRTAIAAARERLVGVDVDGAVEAAVDAALAANVASLRADVAIVRAARAHAALAGRAVAGAEDVSAVAPLIVRGRAVSTPGASGAAEPPARSTTPPASATRSRADVGAQSNPSDDERGREEPGAPPPRAQSSPPMRTRDGVTGGDAAARTTSADGESGSATPTADGGTDAWSEGPSAAPRRHALVAGVLGRPRVHRDGSGREAHELGASRDTGAVSVARTVLARLERQGSGPVGPEDLRRTERARRDVRCVVLLVDASGSQAAELAIAIATGVAEELLLHAYQARAHVAAVAFGGDGASVVLRPTRSIEVARARLGAIERRGATPLAAGLEAARELVAQLRHRGMEPLLVAVTDGRPTVGVAGLGPIEAALRAARELARLDVDGLVVEVPRAARDGLDLAARLATEAGLGHVVAADA